MYICVCMCGDPTCFRSVHLLARYGPPKNKNKVAKPFRIIIEHVSFVFEIRNVSATMFHTMSLKEKVCLHYLSPTIGHAAYVSALH